MKIHRLIIGISWTTLGALIVSPLIMGFATAQTSTLIIGGLEALLMLAAGFVLMSGLTRYSWVCLPCTALSLFIVPPIGAALGLYYLWLYFAKEKRVLSS